MQIHVTTRVIQARSGTQRAPRVARSALLAACLALPQLGAGRAEAKEVPKPILPPTPIVSSTVPANGDLNPYGVAFVPSGFPGGGPLAIGDILVSNFNNSGNLQGTGTTIVDVAPDGTTSLFFPGTPPLGLTTGLVILKKGLVVVGNFPSPDGTCENAQPGSLLVIDSHGNLVQTLTDPSIAGPWDMTADDDGDRAKLYVSNALTGVVERLDVDVGSASLTLRSATPVATGYVHRCDPMAFVVSPTGLALDRREDLLFVASTGDNAVFAVEHPGKRSSAANLGRLVYQDDVHLHGPNGMALGPCGHLFAGQSDVINSDPNQPSEYVEFTEKGEFVSQLSIDPAQGGAFGLAVERLGDDFIRFAAVDDNANDLNVWKLAVPECGDDDH
jgi:hypothetical protein